MKGSFDWHSYMHGSLMAGAVLLRFRKLAEANYLVKGGHSWRDF